MQFVTKHKDSLLKVCRNYLLPLMLCYAVMRIIIKTYFDFYSTLSIILGVVYMGALFWLYEKIKPKKIIRGIVFLVVGAAIVGITALLINIGQRSSGMWFMNWFYVSGGAAGRVDAYSAAVFTFFCFFIASIVYYFSMIRFRASGLMLAVILPFIIYGKRAMSIGSFDMALMVTVYLALIIHGKLTADDVKHDTVFNYSYVIACLVFVTFVGMVTMFVPKPKVTSYLENNRNFFDFRVNSDLNAFSSLNEQSSDRFGADATGELLFRVATNSNDDVLYLRRQTFDEFTNERWVVNQEIYKDLSNTQSNRDPAGSSRAYFDAMKAAVNGSSVKADKTLLDFYAQSPYDESELRYISLEYEDAFRPSYLCAELNIDTSDSRNSGQIYRSVHSEAYARDDARSMRRFLYYFFPVNKPIMDYVKSSPYDTEKFLDLLSDMRASGQINRSAYSSIIKEIDYYTDKKYYVISDRMAQLAQQITANCKNDYEKGEAIVNYFATNGYTYDLEYMPPDESIDYFVFESKTGSCTSYATAMTLMARSVGLPARYVEGFAVYEKDPDDPTKMLVRDTNAHAFVECYIAGVGWMNFDPTVPEYMNISSGTGTATAIGTIASYVGRAALFLGAAFVLIFIVLLDRIDERIFRIRTHGKPLDRRTILLYQRVIKLLDRSHTNKKFGGFTPQKIDDYVKNELGGNIELLTVLFQSTCFGQIPPTKEQFEQAYAQYKQSWKVITKGKRPTTPQKVTKKPLPQGNL